MSIEHWMFVADYAIVASAIGMCWVLLMVGFNSTTEAFYGEFSHDSPLRFFWYHPGQTSGKTPLMVWLIGLTLATRLIEDFGSAEFLVALFIERTTAMTSFACKLYREWQDNALDAEQYLEYEDDAEDEVMEESAGAGV